MNEQKNEGKVTKRNWLTAMLAIGIVVCMGITVWAVFFRDADGPSGPISPDYPPQGTEGNQKPIEGDNSTKIDSPEGGGAISITADLVARASLSTGRVTYHYEHPNSSNQNVAVYIQVGELVVAKSELITPGHQIDMLTLDEYAAKQLSVGGYNAMLVIRSYNDDGEKSMVDTKVEITLIVNE